MSDPGPEIFWKCNPDPAQAGMCRPGSELGIVKNFEVTYINFSTVCSQINFPQGAEY